MERDACPLRSRTAASSSTTDARFDACNFIPASRINQVSKNILSYLPLPHASGQCQQLLRRSRLQLGFPQDRHEDHLQRQQPAEPERPFQLSAGQRERRRACTAQLVTTLWPSGRSWTRTSAAPRSPRPTSSRRTSSSTACSGSRGSTPTRKPPGKGTCWGDVVTIKNACQPPLQRDYAMPRVDIFTPSWSWYGNGIRVNDNTASVFDYLDPQWQWVMNAGWNKGAHNVKFGIDVHRLHMNHYEITAPSFNFTGGASALNGGVGSEPVQRLRRFPARPADLAKHGAAESAAERRERQQRAVGDAPVVGVRHLHPRSVSVDAQADGVGGRALGVLPCSAARRSRRRDLRLHAEPSAALRPRRHSDRLWHRSAERSLHAAPRRCVSRDRFAGLSRRLLAQSAERQHDRRPHAQLPGERADQRRGDRRQQLHARRQLQRRLPAPADPDPDAGDGSARRRGNITTNEVGQYTRGVISTFNVSVQKVLPHNFTAQVGYVGNRQNDMVRNQNLNYSQIGGGNASLPFNQPGLAGGFRTTAARSTSCVRWATCSTTRSR